MAKGDEIKLLKQESLRFIRDFEPEAISKLSIEKGRVIEKKFAPDSLLNDLMQTILQRNIQMKIKILLRKASVTCSPTPF